MEKAKDLASVISQSEDGTYTIVRSTSEGISYEAIRKLREGESIPQGQEVIHLEQIGDKNLYDVTTLVSGTRSSTGPVQVATKAYRDGYDQIFGSKKEQTLN